MEQFNNSIASHEENKPNSGFRRFIPSLNLSPINERRWETFRANRRGYWSLWIFLFLFFFSLFAEFIANDKPLIIKYDGKLYFPVLFTYTETDFGGLFATEADYRDPVLECLVRTNGSEQCEDDTKTTDIKGATAGWFLWPPIRYSYKTINLDYPRIKADDGLCLGFPSPPNWIRSQELCDAPPEQLERFRRLGNTNWLGTDDQGRDVVARVIYGFRISILFGLALTLFSSIVGIAAGAVQGYFGGWTDLIFQRFIEVWNSIPTLYLLIIVASIIEPNFWILLGILLLFSWVALVGVVRAEFLRGRNLEYIRAARALGLTSSKIMLKHLLPNAMVATLTFMPFILNGSITTLTSLDFLGFGLPPGDPSLGELLKQGKANLQAPWLGLTAFFVIAIMLSLLIFIGEAVRDALDPRKTFE
jgi:microcin C transport system permease protein